MKSIARIKASINSVQTGPWIMLGWRQLIVVKGACPLLCLGLRLVSSIVTKLFQVRLSDQ